MSENNRLKIANAKKIPQKIMSKKTSIPIKIITFAALLRQKME